VRARPWGPRYTRSDLTLANAFTGLRLVLIPVFGWLWAHGENERALWVFGVAAATDAVDGFLARWLNQMSRLGALLDPIADKLLMLVSVLVGVHVGAVPLWLAVIVLARDFVLLVGVVVFSTAWRDRHGMSAWRPTRLGKYAMFSQSVSIILAIVESTLAPVGLRAYVESVMVVTAALTLIAGAQYTVRAVRALMIHERGETP